ncbi:MAG: hypothetical protein AB1757_19335 [Acidobacteriota bacterium]
MATIKQSHIEKVKQELARYEHPLFIWEAFEVAGGVDVYVHLKYEGIHEDAYKFHLTPREIEAHAFVWDFQRQLYNYLHDYLIEMFTRSPHINE